MNIMGTDTRTIYVSFVAWLLENLVKRITIATKNPKNILTNIVNIFKSILKTLKVSNYAIFRNSKNIMKPNYLPCF